MANPQAEDGYTKIANEIMEALAKIRISGEARQVLDVILRKTYGWGKKKDRIALSQFHEATGGMKKPSISRAIRTLLAIKLIIVSENANRNGQEYEFNKDYETWKPLAKKLIVSNIAKGVSENAKKRLQKCLPQKKKETIQKKEYKPLVFLTDEEYQKLTEKYTKPIADDYIEQLSMKLGSKFIKYDSHYLTILNYDRRGYFTTGQQARSDNPADAYALKLREIYGEN